MISENLVKRFINDYEEVELSKVRGRYGFLSGIVGIIANIFLFGVKLAIGLIINSIAFIGDAFNNLTDAASSLAIILGFKLANKPADEKHPFGHGRLEYITGLIVSFIIILVGYELLKSSVNRIFNPVSVDFSLPALLIVVFSILVKGWLFIFNRYLSKAIDSKALLATAYDSLSDTIATACIGLSLIASLYTTFPFDGYVGVVVSGIILYSGLSLTKETISPLLGETPELELITKISEKVRSYDMVMGVHDLIVHSYGPNQYMASIHVEIPANEDIMEMHECIDNIEIEVAKELGVLLTIHMDPLNVDSKELMEMKEEVSEILKEFPEILSYHDFRIVGKGDKENIIFDVVVKSGTSEKKEKKLRSVITKRIKEKHPAYQCIITFDQNDMLINEKLS